MTDATRFSAVNNNHAESPMRSALPPMRSSIDVRGHALRRLQQQRRTRRRLRTLLVLLLLAACSSGNPVPQRGRDGGRPRAGVAPRPRAQSPAAARIEQRSYLFAPTNERLEYAVYVSPNVNRDRPSPLVIVLHGLGMEPMRFLPQVINAVPSSGYIMAAPMGYNPEGWYGANGANGIGAGRRTGSPPNLGELSEQDVMNVLALMRSEYNVDPNRIYIFGNSMCGAGALHLGIKHRAVWAAVGARSTANRSGHPSPDELAPAPDLPMVPVHCDADRLVPVEQSRRWAAKMHELGITYEYHELKGVGHGVDRDGVRLIFRFFDRHVKQSAQEVDAAADAGSPRARVVPPAHVRF